MVIVVVLVAMVVATEGLRHSLMRGQLSQQVSVKSVKKLSAHSTTHALGDSTAYSTDDAFAMLKFAFIAYCDPATVQTWTCNSCDPTFGNIQYLDTNYGMAYVADNGKDTIVVSFEGTSISTKPLSAVMDLDFAPHPVAPSDFCSNCPCSGCQVHQGFWDVHEAYVDFVDGAVTKAMQRMTTTTTKMMITGHSLGAAEAVLYALHYVMSTGHTPIVYTYGCPKVGNMNFVNVYSQHLPFHYAVIHNQDLVPHLPPSILDVFLVPHIYWCSGDTMDTCTAMPGLTDTASITNWHISIDDHVDYFGLMTRATPGFNRGSAPTCGNI